MEQMQMDVRSEHLHGNPANFPPPGVKQITEMTPDEFRRFKLNMLVDQIGELDAKIAALQADRKEMTDQLKAAGPGSYKGILWDAVVFIQSVKQTDWKAIAMRFKTTARYINRHTEVSPRVVLKVTGK